MAPLEILKPAVQMGQNPISLPSRALALSFSEQNFPMDVDPDDVFRDDEEDPENDFYLQKEATKEFAVYLVDASPKMFSTTTPGEDQKDETHFHIAISCIARSLKTQIISRSYDEVAICFFNTREKKNLQDLNGVFFSNVAEREYLDRPTARLLKEFDHIEGKSLWD